MKKSELSFKCILGSTKRNKQMYDAIILARIKNSIREEDFVKSAMCIRIDDTWSNEVSPTYSSTITESYEDAAIPEVTFEAALEMLSSIEPDAQEFDIKFSEKCLGKNNTEDSWKVVSFGAIGNQAFRTLENGSINMVTPLTRDVFLNLNDIDGWWECENGKPVWRTK